MSPDVNTTTYHLSFDCANKSLAHFGCEESDKPNTNGDVKRPLECLSIADINHRVFTYGVVDLLPGQKVSETTAIYRIKQLHKYLTNIPMPPDSTPSNTTIYIEYQMGPNAKSHDVSSAIMMFYAKYDVRIVGPSLKNTIAFNEDLRIQKFMSKYSTSYAANKAHAQANLIYYCRHKAIDIDNMDKSVLHNLGDALMQYLAVRTARTASFRSSNA